MIISICNVTFQNTLLFKQTTCHPCSLVVAIIKSALIGAYLPEAPGLLRLADVERGELLARGAHTGSKSQSERDGRTSGVPRSAGHRASHLLVRVGGRVPGGSARGPRGLTGEAAEDEA